MDEEDPTRGEDSRGEEPRADEEEDEEGGTTGTRLVKAQSEG